MTAISLTRARSARVQLLGALGFAAAMAAAAQVALPIPGTPVPVTLQPLVVVLAGLWLGPAAGAASMALYLLAGAAGLPVWAPVGAPGALRLLGPTGGYLLGMPVAALVVGWLDARARSLAGRFLATSAGVVTILVCGLAQLTILTGTVAAAVAAGITPFVLVDFLKAGLAALAGPRRTGRTEV